MTTELSPALQAIRVPVQAWSRFWWTHFGEVPRWFTLESRVFNGLARLCQDYSGGGWQFYTLSNGGAFMAPDSDERWSLRNTLNGNDATLSSEAAGLTVCLLAWSHHACQTEHPRMTAHYYQLRDYALTHPECRGIMAIID